jgi:hypothetical protein
MKNSIKLTAILAIAFSAGTMRANAQASADDTSDPLGKPTLSVGLETSLSVGKFNHEHKGSLGGTIGLDLPVADMLSVNFTSGYNNFYGRVQNGFEPKGLRLIPITAGAKFFPFSNFYLQANLGAGFLTNKTELGYNNSSAILYAPGVGVQMPVGGSSFIDASIKYEASSRFGSDSPGSKVSVFGLRVAYAFGL